MGKRNQFKDEIYEKIITDRLVFGKKVETIAEETGFGPTSIFNTISVFNAVKEGDWNRCVALIENQRFSFAPFVWAASKLGVELPAEVTDAYENRIKKSAEQRAEAEKTEVETVMPVTPNDAVYFIKILEALNRQNELLAQLLDAVIPHWVNDLKDNINANGDAILDRINEEIKITECIKQNTRKRGL